MRFEVAIVGAGPYGLSIAAHLKAQNVHVRIFGPAMDTWRNAMPSGMFLKSEGFASSLSDPASSFTLAHYCTAEGIPYADTGIPVGLDTFTNYCLAFQQRFVPDLDVRQVARIDRDKKGYWLTLEDGTVVAATCVVVAAGITHYAHMPRELGVLSQEVRAHSSKHRDLSGFAGKTVTVLGAGASALDCAALLVEVGASVQLVARRGKIRFHEPPTGRPRTLLERIRSPMSGLGPGWRSRLCTDAPLLFRALPQRLRLKIVQRHLGAAPGWWTRAAVEKHVSFHLGAKLRGAVERDGKVLLELETATAEPRVIESDYVIAATGYRVDLRRLPFMTLELLKDLKTAEGSPVLSSRFESTVPGLFFVGVSAAGSFGPMMRFAYGAAYTSRRLADYLARQAEPRFAVISTSVEERSVPSRA
jgi:cation diffusion facilitator CzcD-associated flavoprotein CzcO